MLDSAVMTTDKVLARLCFGALLGTALALPGCSSSDDSSPGSGPAEAYCNDACARRVAADCPADKNLSRCLAGCSGLSSFVGTCGSQIQALQECVQSRGTFSCTLLGTAELKGCDSETANLNQCTVCPTDAADTPQVICGKTHCCVERTSLLAAPGEAAYEACIKGCTDITTTVKCLSDCEKQYPSAAAAYNAYSACTFLNKCL